ncbi:30S ribosomal protein 3 [Spatholobus suberectus]|nr:30S ribosomal protein 3 [Spatholobus suberectus]
MNMLSMALVHPNLLPTCNSNPVTFPSIKLKPSHSRPHVPPPIPTRFRLSASAAEIAVAEEDPPPSPQPKKLGVVVKPTGKPRLVLKFIWMEKNIGIALDQMVPGHGTIPLSPYYFWPRKDAWEELKELLESKPWISQKQMIILLNQATDIINLWQQSGGNLS